MRLAINDDDDTIRACVSITVHPKYFLCYMYFNDYKFCSIYFRKMDSGDHGERRPMDTIVTRNKNTSDHLSNKSKYNFATKHNK